MDTLLIPPGEREDSSFLQGRGEANEEAELKLRQRIVATESPYLFRMNAVLGGLFAATSLLIVSADVQSE
jgi:hypothetical protein